MKRLGLEEAAGRLAVQPLKLRRWARDGKIESVRLGRRVVFRESALEAFIQANVQDAKLPTPHKNAAPRAATQSAAERRSLMSLAPEHLEDLHKSGLTDTTIAACVRGMKSQASQILNQGETQ